MGELEFTIFLFASFFTALILFVMAVLAFNLKAREARVFGILSGLISLWSFFIGGKMLSVTEEIAFVWAILITVAGSFTSPMFFLFAFYYANRTKKLSWWKTVPLFIEPLLAVAFFVIPSLRHLYIIEFFYADVLGYLVTVGWRIGPYYWVHMAFSAVFIVLGDVIILRHAMEWSKKSQEKVILLVVATTIPMLTALVRMLNLTPGIHGNIDVFAFSLATVIAGLVVYQEKILEFQPISGRQLMEELPDPLLVFDTDKKVVEMNSSAKFFFDELQDAKIKQQFDLFLQDPRLDKGEHIRQKLSLDHDGAKNHFEVHLSPLQQSSQIIGYQVFLRDVTELTYSNAQLELLATTDPLTGLYNRRYFYLEGDHIFAMSVRYRRPICVMTFDIDRFKRINDSYGHPIGDEALVQVAAIIRSTVRKADIAARFGGDEFFILLPESTTAPAIALAKRIQTRLAENPFRVGEEEMQINFSFGIAAFQPNDANDSFSLDELMREADLNLYKAKHDGRNLIRSVSI